MTVLVFRLAADRLLPHAGVSRTWKTSVPLVTMAVAGTRTIQSTAKPRPTQLARTTLSSTRYTACITRARLCLLQMVHIRLFCRPACTEQLFATCMRVQLYGGNWFCSGIDACLLQWGASPRRVSRQRTFHVAAGQGCPRS